MTPKFMTYILPETAGDPGLEFPRARNTCFVLFYLLVFGIFFLVFNLARGFGPAALGSLIMLVAALAAALVLKKTASIHWTAALMTSGIYANILLNAAVYGGIHSSSMVWFIFVPIIPVLLSGIRAGMVWGGISLVSITAVAWFTDSGVIPDAPVSSTLDRTVDYIGVALATGILFHYYDATEQHLISGFKEARNKAQSSALRMETLARELETIFENSQVGIMLLKGGRYFAKGNQRLADILGYDRPEDMAGFSMRQLHLSGDMFREFGKKHYNPLISGEQIQIEYQLCRKDNTPVWCSLSGKAIDRNRPPDLDKGVLWVIDDIEGKKQMEFRLREMATQDSLTRLCNRRQFMKLAVREFNRSRRKGHPLSLLMIDADHFKRINDTHGHSVGDEVLKNLAATGNDCIRDIDLLARLGGEEFAVLLPETALAQAVQVGERIRMAAEKARVRINPQTRVSYTISIGAAAMDEEMIGVDDLMVRADTALYAAKGKGRNRVMPRV